MLSTIRMRGAAPCSSSHVTGRAMNSPSASRDAISSTATGGRPPGRVSLRLLPAMRPSSAMSRSSAFSGMRSAPLMPKARELQVEHFGLARGNPVANRNPRGHARIQHPNGRKHARRGARVDDLHGLRLILRSTGSGHHQQTGEHRNTNHGSTFRSSKLAAGPSAVRPSVAPSFPATPGQCRPPSWIRGLPRAPTED